MLIFMRRYLYNIHKIQVSQNKSSSSKPKSQEPFIFKKLHKKLRYSINIFNF